MERGEINIILRGNKHKGGFDSILDNQPIFSVRDIILIMFPIPSLTSNLFSFRTEQIGKVNMWRPPGKFGLILDNHFLKVNFSSKYVIHSV